jgi:hypothetical protein
LPLRPQSLPERNANRELIGQEKRRQSSVKGEKIVGQKPQASRLPNIAIFVQPSFPYRDIGRIWKILEINWCFHYWACSEIKGVELII